MRIRRMIATMNMMPQPTILRIAADRVLSSSSGKTGGAKNLRKEFCILEFSSFKPFDTGGFLKDLNGNFRIAQQVANFPDCRLQNLLIFVRGADRGSNP